MYFHITKDSAELVDPHDLTALRVVCPADLDDDALADAVRRAELGELLPGGTHLMVPIDAIRARAAGRVGPGWEQEFTGMIAYATGKGWVDGDRVRAHLERTG